VKYSVDISYVHLSMVSFNSRICLNDLSIGDRGVLKSSTTTVLGLHVILSPLVYV
jgi:hypothetical protein